MAGKKQVAKGAAREGTARDPIPRRAGSAASAASGRGGMAGIAKGTTGGAKRKMAPAKKKPVSKPVPLGGSGGWSTPKKVKPSKKTAAGVQRRSEMVRRFGGSM